MLDEGLSAQDAERIARVVAGHPQAEGLGRLAYSVLSRQAEGGSLFSGKKYMRQQAKAHGVSREEAETPLGNLLQILERAPDGPRERGLVAGFALAGFELALAEQLGLETLETSQVSDEAVEGERPVQEQGARDAPPTDASRDQRERAQALCARFVRHLDWLTLATPYRLEALVPRLLTGTALRHLTRALCQAVALDQSAAAEGDPAARARIAARLSLLTRLPRWHAARARLLDHVRDPFTLAMLHASEDSRALAEASPGALADDADAQGGGEPVDAAGGRPSEPKAVAADEAAATTDGPEARHPDRQGQEREQEMSDDGHREPAVGAAGQPSQPQAEVSEPLRVAARMARAPAGPLLGWLRWLSGWALVTWLARSLLWLVGVRRQAAFTLAPGGVRVTAETRVVGRVFSTSERFIPYEALRFGRRHVRYPGLRRLVGLVGFCVGVVVGAVLLFDGLAVMERGLMLVGAGILGAGVLLDLIVDVLLAGHRGRVALELAGGGRRVCLRGVPLQQADAFMDALARCGAGMPPSDERARDASPASSGLRETGRAAQAGDSDRATETGEARA